jgi:BMFP domain-containing protein YqiC
MLLSLQMLTLYPRRVRERRALSWGVHRSSRTIPARRTIVKHCTDEVPSDTRARLNRIPADRTEQRMAAGNFMDDLNARLAELFASSPAKDLERNVKAMMSGAFARMDLVTREEFDVQAKVLARTREKLAELERRVAELEAAAAPRSE